MNAGAFIVTALLCAFALAAPAQGAGVTSLNAVQGAATWFVEDHSVPMIALVASLPAGSAYDPKGKYGLSDFAGQLLDEGAGTMDARAYHDALADRAIQLSVTPSRDYLVVSLVTLTDNAADAFRLLGLALQHPRFDQSAISRVRAQMQQALVQEGQDPATVANKGFYAVYFAGHPYAHAPEGDTTGLAGVNGADLRDFVHTHWVRGGLKIAVSGDATPVAITALLQSAFGGLPGTTPARVPPVTRKARPQTAVIPMDVPQAVAAFGFSGPKRNDPDFMAAYVANDIVGGGDFSSRLTDEVRVKRGLTYGISTDIDPRLAASLIEGSVATRKDSMRQSIAVTRDVLATFAEDGPTQQELTDAQTYLTGSFPLSFASNVSTATQLGIFQRQGLAPGYVASRNGLIMNVSLDDVRRVAKRFFNPARLTIVIAGTLGRPDTSSRPSR